MKFNGRIADTELTRRGNIAKENIGYRISSFFTRILGLKHGCAFLRQIADYLCTTAKNDKHHGFTGSDKRI